MVIKRKRDNKSMQKLILKMHKMFIQKQNGIVASNTDIFVND